MVDWLTVQIVEFSIKIDDSGKVGNKGLLGEQQNIFSKNIYPSGD